jgi:hypothetical protein
MPFFFEKVAVAAELYYTFPEQRRYLPLGRWIGLLERARDLTA